MMARMVKAGYNTNAGGVFKPRGSLATGFPDNGLSRTFGAGGPYGPSPITATGPFRAMAHYTASPKPNRVISQPGIRRP